MTRARAAALIVWTALGGCAGAKVDPGAQGGADLGTAAAPKSPPIGIGGGPTAQGCNGITEKGRCEISDKGQVAVTCDVSANQVRRFDCSAMGKVCVLDSTRGAICTTLLPPTSGGADMGRPPVPPDLAAPPRDMARLAVDMATAPRDMATAPMCASGVDYRGYCASATSSGAWDTAIWCDPGTGQTLVVNCAARGQVCAIDQCA
jgi:hypothetical protein